MDFTAPSFSIGIDFDDPPSPAAGSDRREQARGYLAPAAPSFSLGIDSEDDGSGEPHLPTASCRERQARRYEAPDAPSFSLGIDDDEGGDGASEPHVPAGIRRVDQIRRYEAPDAPSFSLGIDDDDDDDFVAGGRCQKQAQPRVAPGPPSWLGLDDENNDNDNDFFLAGDQRSELAPAKTLDPEGKTFKRLRRGPAPPPLVPTPPPRTPPPTMTEPSSVLSGKATLAVGSLVDEIEDFTDEEQPAPGIPPSVGSCSTSRNKPSLLNHGVFISQSTRNTKLPKFTQTPNSFASRPLEESCTKKLLPKITISPMRKIQLLDSDTDTDDDKDRYKANKPASLVKKIKESLHKYVPKKPTLQQNSKPASPVKKSKESLHKYVPKKPTLQQNSKPEGSTFVQKSEAKMTDSWATPALDDFCNEYFTSVRESRPSLQKEVSFSGSRASQPYYGGEIGGHVQNPSTSDGSVPAESLTDSHPPALHYYFHQDLMVQNLVRERLPHFVPIRAESNRENEQNGTDHRNQRSQFSLSAAADGRWVTPNRSASVPTDVGKRRVRASGAQSGSGHWFTGEDGRKVYVTKNGQELTGSGAYRQYRKESGRGLHKSKKKSAVKKEVPSASGPKKGSSRLKKSTSAAKRSSTAKRKR